MAKRVFLHCQLTLILAVFSGCVSDPDSAHLGIQDGFQSFVPAKISVIPCQSLWESKLVNRGVLSNVSDEDGQKVCREFDQFVLRGFSDQPFMKGYSPKAVGKLLKRAESSALLEELKTHWQPINPPCDDCASIRSAYLLGISKSPSWLQWLHKLSKATRNSDAILLPMINAAVELRTEDRGLLIARRDLKVSMLLISTIDGRLIWYGKRNGALPTQKLKDDRPHRELKFASWKELTSTTLTESLWREFPGRIVR